ncbi:putative gustatory receptor 28b [Linepithema humile]|uniref:putative gustatory receptor 28b n=1 Tax=Linepithema humile TaxID=83485 RepID=UPI000623212A|nr:PREDICTED: uncharacterized protein LOC105678180 [Linepithema humile]
MFVDLLFVTFLWYIGTKFDNVNEHMRCLLIKKKRGLRRAWRTVTPITRLCITYTGNYKCVLWTSMHLHLELCQIARELNAMFGIQITLEMLAHLIHLTRLISYFFINVKIEDHHLLTSIGGIDFQVWIWIYVVRIFGLNYICENVSEKANRIKRIIHYLSDSLRYADVREEIHQFILQTIHHPLKFTGLNLFYFGNGFLQKFFIKVSTLVMIVVQMSNTLSPNTSAGNFKEK